MSKELDTLKRVSKGFFIEKEDLRIITKEEFEDYGESLRTRGK